MNKIDALQHIAAIASEERNQDDLLGEIQGICREALQQPDIHTEPSLVGWVLFDATSDKKFIKLYEEDGLLAIFDSEAAAIEAKSRNPGSDYVLREYFASPQPSVAVTDGWQLVPVEPTTEMLRAAQDAWLADPLRRTSSMYKAMLDAATASKESHND